MKHDARCSDEQKRRHPFFARFLEGQDSLRVKSDLRGGKGTSPLRDVPDHTMKYPSDDDEGETS
jgi:hypothetical protein